MLLLIRVYLTLWAKCAGLGNEPKESVLIGELSRFLWFTGNYDSLQLLLAPPLMRRHENSEDPDIKMAFGFSRSDCFCFLFDNFIKVFFCKWKFTPLPTIPDEVNRFRINTWSTVCNSPSCRKVATTTRNKHVFILLLVNELNGFKDSFKHLMKNRSQSAFHKPAFCPNSVIP